MHAQEACPDGRMYHYRKFEGSFVNASDRLACQAITDRGFAMIPLPSWGRTWAWRMHKKKGVTVSTHQWEHHLQGPNEDVLGIGVGLRGFETMLIDCAYQLLQHKDRHKPLVTGILYYGGAQASFPVPSAQCPVPGGGGHGVPSVGTPAGPMDRSRGTGRRQSPKPPTAAGHRRGRELSGFDEAAFVPEPKRGGGRQEEEEAAEGWVGVLAPQCPRPSAFEFRAMDQWTRSVAVGSLAKAGAKGSSVSSCAGDHLQCWRSRIVACTRAHTHASTAVADRGCAGGSMAAQCWGDAACGQCTVLTVGTGYMGWVGARGVHTFINASQLL